MHLFKQVVFAVTMLAAVITPTTFAQTPVTHNKAQRIISDSLDAMGGLDAYNNTRYISWLFFGRRFHVWDKYTGDIRIETSDNQIILMNINSKTGEVWKNGHAVTDEAELAKALQFGYEAWINDSYWLVMPFKMRDPGVHVNYEGEQNTALGRAADVLQMTFEDVGVTPENKYQIFFDKETHLVSQWRYYAKASDTAPAFELSWSNWVTYGDIKLSDTRGERSLGPVNVYQHMPDSALHDATVATQLPGAILK